MVFCYKMYFGYKKVFEVVCLKKKIIKKIRKYEEKKIKFIVYLGG